ncbi:MAG: FAD:protein FMN transferase [Clostridia bacterium]|nr:FAD:protein FMN transferase [Clostridia bacterium]
MKKITAFYLALLLFSLCGCEENNKNSQTRFLLDTVVTLTADCNDEILSGAFELCENYEKMLSRTIKESDVQKLNSSEGFITVSEETAEIIEKALYYSELSNGKFDITVYSVSSLWDFNNQIVPDRSEIAEALQNIDYQSIEIEENCVNLNGRQIDLGGIAKGYIADRLKDYFTGNGTDSGIINLGGNIVVFGDDYKIGIQKPFSNDISATLHLKNCSAVTSGIYQRYIKSGDKIYHHIIDPDTGYGVENELAGVTIIGESSFDCDALSTVCMLLGTENGKKLIENTDGFEAVFIDRKGKFTITDGLFKKDKDIYLK